MSTLDDLVSFMHFCVHSFSVYIVSVVLIMQIVFILLLNLCLKIERFTKYDSKLDFDCKNILKLESNAKVTQKICEITGNSL